MVASSGEEQNWQVEGEVGLIRQGTARHGGDESSEHGVTGADTDQETAGEGEQQAFGDELLGRWFCGRTGALRKASSLTGETV